MDDLAKREFREYVAARQSALFRTAMLLTGHREDAEDLLQAALTKLALRWHQVVRTDPLDAYVRKIMYHQYVSWWRRHRTKREYPSAMLPDTCAPGDFATDSALRLALAKALGELTHKQRAVVVLRFYEDLPEADVAALLGCSVGTVRSQVHRTLTRLRALCPELSPVRGMV